MSDDFVNDPGFFIPEPGFQWRYSFAVISFIMFRTRALLVGYVVFGAWATYSAVDLLRQGHWDWWVTPAVVVGCFFALYVAGFVRALRETLSLGMFLVGEPVRVRLVGRRVSVAMSGRSAEVNVPDLTMVRTGFGLVMLGKGRTAVPLPRRAIPSSLLRQLKHEAKAGVLP
jgi:hypothetical protein